MAKHLTDAEFLTSTAEGVTVVDFWAPWCGPCRMQGPVIDALSEKYEGQVEFFKMNVDEEQKVAQEFGVMSIPTLLVKKDGQPVENLIGYHDQAKLEAILAQYL